MLRLSHDRKVANCRNDKNSFGLLPGPKGSCPNASIGPGGCWSDDKCPICYAEKLRRLYKGVDTNLRYNTRKLKKATYTEAVEILSSAFDSYLKTNKSNNFRIHWSGDIFSIKYAAALNTAILKTPKLKFWNYTRSFDYVEVFTGTPNVITYISLDRKNLKKGIKYVNKHPELFKKDLNHFRISYMSPINDFKELTNYKVVSCPVDDGKLDLLYACSKCGLCNSNKGSGKVIFFKEK